MEVPPVYAQPRKAKSKVGWIVAIVLVCIICCCGGPAVVVMKLLNGSKPMLTCAMTFKAVADGVRKYALDHKGVLPKAATWQDDTREDYRQALGSQPPNPFGSAMPADGDWACADGDGRRTGISYNDEVAGKKLDSIGDQVSTIMIFETDKVEKNQHAKFAQPDYQASPKIIFSAPRGWMVATVAGEAGLIGQQGKFMPVNMTGGQGVSTEVHVNTGVGVTPNNGAGGKTGK